MIIYFIECRPTKDPYKNPIKIGITSDLSKRIILLQNGNPYKLNCLMYIEVKTRAEAAKLEKRYHEMFAEYRLSGEWFKGSIRNWKSFKRISFKAKVVDESTIKRLSSPKK